MSNNKIKKLDLISKEVFKDPFSGRRVESETFLSYKICLVTIRIRKKIGRQTKGVCAGGQRRLVYLRVWLDVISSTGNRVLPTQAIGLPILRQSKYPNKCIY
jgi:hypothetical protein